MQANSWFILALLTGALTAETAVMPAASGNPDTIAVETSMDSQTFTPAGVAGFKQVFDPPADYVPWELDESLLFKDLPAGGRLAYAFRIILEKPVSARYVRVKCASRKGWGMLLSEIQVFNTVMVETKVPPLVVW